MKSLRVFLSILMIAVLLCSFGVTAFADETTEHVITISNGDAADTHEYTAYQVFVGKYDTATQTLSDIKWGNGVNSAALLAALKEDAAFAACENAADVAQVIATLANGSAELRAVAAKIDANTATAAAIGSGKEEARLTVTGDGYYYVKDTSANLTFDTYSDYILLVEGNVTVEAKDTTAPTAEKKVKDINDSTLEGSGWQDSADYDIGDPVPFKQTATLPGDFDLYTEYKIVFHDQECAGLTFRPNTVKAYVDDVEVTDGFTVVTNPTDGDTFDVVFANVKAYNGITKDSKISIEYESILNENAVIGSMENRVGNPNTMFLEYSNNPTNPTQTGTTPLDKVIVFTYEVVVYKVDDQGNPLAGAEFELYKWYADPNNPDGGEWVLVPGEISGNEGTTNPGYRKIIQILTPLATYDVTYYPDNAGVEDQYLKFRGRDSDANTYSEYYLKVSDVEAVSVLMPRPAGSPIGVTAYKMDENGLLYTNPEWTYALIDIVREEAPATGSTFLWKGIDDGNYKLVEVKAPQGFNVLEDLEFTVTAEHEIESADPQLLEVLGAPFVSSANNIGILEGTIENHRGAVLPSTGGIGTKIFYVTGALLVLAAGILLVIKKFMRTQE